MKELEELIIRIYIQKIENDEKGYKVSTILNSSPSNAIINELSEKAKESINRVSGEYSKGIIEIIKIDKNTEKAINNISIRDLMLNFKDIESKGIVSKFKKESVLNLGEKLKVRGLGAGIYQVEDMDNNVLGEVCKKYVK